MQTRLLAIGAVVLTTAVTACSNSSTESATSGPATTARLIATTSASAGTQPHNNVDLMFANHMIPHHEQAIEMSDMVLAKQGVDPRVVDLAKRIKAAQGPEIDQMRGWLVEWGTPTGMPGHDMGDMGGMGDMPGMGDTGPMAGMMSPSDMTALGAAQGAAASKLYITQMIEHHRGAITMAQNEIDNGQAAAAIALARSIISAQQQEIDEMTAMLPTL